jgi:hypothetical protein
MLRNLTDHLAATEPFWQSAIVDLGRAANQQLLHGDEPDWIDAGH